MLRYLPLSILLFLLSACDSGESNGKEDSKAANITIKGTIVGAQETSILLEAMSTNGTIKVAETVSNSAGEFELEGNIPGLGIYQLRIGQSQEMVVPMTLSPHEGFCYQSTPRRYRMGNPDEWIPSPFGQFH
jgi:hypothetical protein